MRRRTRVPAEWNAGFDGGPPALTIAAGREQLIVLLEHGMAPASRVLDIGCGALRGGRWIIPLLDPGNYYGIEPQDQMVARGLQTFLDPVIVKRKRPRFDHNDRFDFSVFGTTFTHFLARSIWTHASKPQIELMLDGFAHHGTPDAVFLTSYGPANRPENDYAGAEWRGRSHESEEPAGAAHSFDWIERACRARDLDVVHLDRPPMNSQRWLRITRA